MRLKWITIAFVAVAFLFHCLPTGAAPKTYPPNSKSNPLVPAYTNVSYGEHARNKLDFWQAKSDKPTPVIMILHGGGWTAGSKANVSRSPRFPNLRAIVGQGISVVAIEYLVATLKASQPPRTTIPSSESTEK